MWLALSSAAEAHRGGSRGVANEHCVRFWLLPAPAILTPTLGYRQPGVGSELGLDPLVDRSGFSGWSQ